MSPGIRKKKMAINTTEQYIPLELQIYLHNKGKPGSFLTIIQASVAVLVLTQSPHLGDCGFEQSPNSGVKLGPS